MSSTNLTSQRQASQTSRCSFDRCELGFIPDLSQDIPVKIVRIQMVLHGTSYFLLEGRLPAFLEGGFGAFADLAVAVAPSCSAGLRAAHRRFAASDMARRPAALKRRFLRGLAVRPISFVAEAPPTRTDPGEADRREAI